MKSTDWIELNWIEIKWRRFRRRHLVTNKGHTSGIGHIHDTNLLRIYYSFLLLSTLYFFYFLPRKWWRRRRRRTEQKKYKENTKRKVEKNYYYYHYCYYYFGALFFCVEGRGRWGETRRCHIPRRVPHQVSNFNSVQNNQIGRLCWPLQSDFMTFLKWNSDSEIGRFPISTRFKSKLLLSVAINEIYKSVSWIELQFNFIGLNLLSRVSIPSVAALQFWSPFPKIQKISNLSP